MNCLLSFTLSYNENEKGNLNIILLSIYSRTWAGVIVTLPWFFVHSVVRGDHVPALRRLDGSGGLLSDIAVNYCKPCEKLNFCSIIDGLPRVQSIVETSSLLPAFPVIRPWSFHFFSEESNSNTSVSPPEKFYVKDWDVPTFPPSK